MSKPAAAKRPGDADVLIGGRLAALREKAGLSQPELVRRMLAVGLDISQAQLSHYELGKNKVPASLLAVAAPILRCKVEEFFGGAVSPS